MLFRNRRLVLVVRLFIFFLVLVFHDLSALGASKTSSLDDDFYESKFSWDIATDNPETYNIIPEFDLKTIVEEISKTESNVLGSRRKKRSSHNGKGVYKQIASIGTQKLPFSASVRVSQHCSGTLISDRHVLTAAHCVHDGKRPKYKLPFLKIGFLRRNSHFHWIRVTKMYIPNQWKVVKGKRGKRALDADFAVLRLKRPHDRSYLTPQKSAHRLRPRIRFNGFPANKGGNAMWHSSCRVEKRMGSILLSRCGASVGSSGSGIYVSRGKGRYAITGLVSAAVKVRGNRKYGYSFTVTTELTTAKVKMICRWMGKANC